MKTTRAILMACAIFATVPALAQDDEETEQTESAEESRAAQFRTVTGPQAPEVPGGALMLGAYITAWVLTMGFFWRVGRLHARNAADLERLQKHLEKD